MNLQPTIKYKKVKSAEEQWTACYCRLSCDDDLDGDSNSTRNQKMLLQKYADENRLRNVMFYVDDGYSGSNFDRPDFKRMMDDVRSFIDKVTVHEKTKVNGHYRQTVEIIYNFVGAIVPAFFDDDED